MSAARKKAFLKALTESGNQTLSAERAKVSRSWVQLQRSTDAQFDAACREAIRKAKESLDWAPASAGELGVKGRLGINPHPENPHPDPLPLAGEGEGVRGRGTKAGGSGRGRLPPAGWQFAAGEELVVSGTNGVRTQVRRAKLKQWTPRVEERFLSALSASCNVRAACAAVGFAVSSAYAHRQRFPAFARAWDEAVAIGCTRLEAALIQAIDHTFDPEAPPPDMPVREVTVTDLIRTLRMYEKRGRNGVVAGGGRGG